MTKSNYLNIIQMLILHLVSQYFNKTLTLVATSIQRLNLAIDILSKITNTKLSYQVLKPHTAPVTSLVSNSEGTTVISGSEDQTIFIFAIRKIQEKNLVNLEPIGYVDTLGPVAHLYWNTEEVIFFYGKPC